ncbi:MAG: hypothetical protein PHX62_03665 [Bacilli bacterium]|nr:hypothetical protein [Bacilli bacterium]
MKRDYSNSNRFGALPVHIPFLLNGLILLPLLLTITKNGLLTLIILGFIDSFLGLRWSGKYLNKNCVNKDLGKCKKCHNWNCTRPIPKEGSDK